VEEISKGALYLVSTPIGHLGDISYRAVDILKRVDLIAAEDTRKSRILCNHYQIETHLTSYHSYNLKKETPRLVRKLLDGLSIALISDAGTPGISDPAYNLVQECVKNRISMIPVPGASAFLAALVVSGMPINKFVYEGFLPAKKGRKTRMELLANESRTMVFYESPHRIIKTVGEFIEYFGNRFCVMGREITKKFEEFYRGNLSELLEHLQQKTVKGEIVIIVEGKQ
jgi:16S rRNA (cytidine1402-2'-O)-methyltransferase